VDNEGELPDVEKEEVEMVDVESEDEEEDEVKAVVGVVDVELAFK